MNGTGPRPTPPWAQAVILLKHLASPLFERAMRSPADSRAAEESFEMWHAVRAIAGRIETTRVVSFDARDRANLKDAVELIHQIEHRGSMTVPPSLLVCECAPARIVRELVPLLATAGVAVEVTDYAA
jgi:hypothetical protein